MPTPRGETSELLQQVRDATVASKQNLWQKNNLNPNLIVAQNGPAAVQALVSGSVDVAANAPENFLPLVSKGEALQLFDGQNRQVFQLVASSSFNPGSATYPQVVAKLKGKKVGITAPGSASYYVTKYLLQQAGLSATDVQYIDYSSVGGAVAAIETQRIDAGLINEPSTYIVQHDHKGQILVDLRNVGDGPALISGIAQVGLWARKSWIAKNPEVVAGIRKTMAEADVFIHDPQNFEAAKAIIGAELPKGYSEAEISEYVNDNLSNIDSSFPLGALDAWIKFDQQMGALAKPLSAKDLMAPGTPGTAAEVQHLASS